MSAQMLGAVAMLYGAAGAASALLQARQMVRRRSSCDVSARFFGTYAGGHLVWLLYGLSIANSPLIAVSAVGLFSGGITLCVALTLRGSLRRPATWNSCS